MNRANNFIRQHQAILKSVQGLESLLTKEVVERDHFNVRTELSKFMGQLKIHLSMEDLHLYPSLIVSDNPETKETAERFQREMGGIAEAVDRFDKKWKDKAIKESPLKFIDEARALFFALGQRMESENSTLFPLI